MFSIDVLQKQPADFAADENPRCLFNSSQRWPTVFVAWPEPKVRWRFDAPVLEDKRWIVDDDLPSIS